MQEQLKNPDHVQLLDPEPDLESCTPTSRVWRQLFDHIQAAGPKQWTLVVREKMWVFDNLQKKHWACFEAAQKLMSLLKEKGFAQPPSAVASIKKDPYRFLCSCISGAESQQGWKVRLEKFGHLGAKSRKQIKQIR